MIPAMTVKLDAGQGDRPAAAMAPQAFSMSECRWSEGRRSCHYRTIRMRPVRKLRTGGSDTHSPPRITLINCYVH